MKKVVFFFIWLGTLNTSVSPAQTNLSKPIQSAPASWPLLVSVQFHSLALPFRDVKSVFSNVGIALGTKYMYNRQENLMQSFQAGFYRNQYAGDGLFVFTQTGYRPHLGPVYAEMKAGLGWHYTFHPNPVLKLENSQWTVSSRTGKGLLMIPLGLSIGYDEKARVSPFVGYQFFALAGYNPAVPVVPNQLLQAGARIRFKD